MVDPLIRDAVEIDAALRLLEQPGIGPARAWSLIKGAGSAVAAGRRLASAPDLLPDLLGELSDAGSHGALAGSKAGGFPKADNHVLDACVRHGISIVFRGDPEYPERLLHLPQPPLLLFVVGDVGLLSRGGVAVVGSRHASSYGRAVARDLGAAAVRAGQVVISGLAVGIDAAAHQGALAIIGARSNPAVPGVSSVSDVSTGTDASSPTAVSPANDAASAFDVASETARPSGHGGALAVLGSGPEKAAPHANAAIYRDLRRHGAVVSEYPPGTTARPWHFPRRNRLIAALANEVIVVEAAEKSGALITARVGLELGREVLAVPGRIDGPGARGSNRLLADGARPVVSIEDWVADRDEFEFRIPGQGVGLAAPDWPEASRILAEFLIEPIDPPSLARRVDWPLSRLLPLLTELELLGVVHRLPGPRYRRAG